MSCSEWQKVRLGDVIEFNPKETIKKKQISKKVSMDKLDTFTRKINGYEEVEFTSGTKFRNGDTLLARITPCLENGKTAQVDILDDGEVAFGSTEFIVLREHKGITINKYIYYLSISPEFRNIAIKCMTGSSGRQRVQKDVLEDTEILLPPIEEQEKIADILSSLDDKIELNNEMNKTLEEMAQSIFKRWFVDFEFPNEEGKPYKSSGGEMVESELGMIPEGWSYGIFSDISKRIYSGGTPNTKEESYWNGLLPWMSSGETRNSFVTNTEKSITELGVVKSSTKLANKYNTVIASAGQGFTRGQTSLLLIDTYVNQSLIVIDGCEEFELFNYINIKLRYNELRAISDSHSIRGSLTTKMIAALGTIIPSIEILKKYNSIIKPIIDIIENNISNTNRLIELRDSLLPKLMSGEIRVDNLETDI